MFSKIIQRYKDLPKKDEKWLVKTLIGGALLYLPIFGWAVSTGYLMKMLESIKEKKEQKLPEWKNIEKLFMDGLPILGMCLVVGIATIFSSFIIGFVPCIGHLISIAFNILINLLIPPIIVIASFRLMETTSWQAALSPGAIIEDLQKDFADYFPMSIGFFICGFVSVIIGCCGLLAPITLFITWIALVPMFAEVYITSHYENQAADTTPASSTPTPVDAAANNKEEPKNDNEKK